MRGCDNDLLMMTRGSGRGASAEGWRGLVVRVVGLLAVAWVLAAMSPQSAFANTTVRVSTEQDQTVQDNECSLREAVSYVDGNMVPDCGSNPAGGGGDDCRAGGLLPAERQRAVCQCGSGREQSDCGGGWRRAAGLRRGRIGDRCAADGDGADGRRKPLGTGLGLGRHADRGPRLRWGAGLQRRWHRERRGFVFERGDGYR